MPRKFGCAALKLVAAVRPDWNSALATDGTAAVLVLSEPSYMWLCSDAIRKSSPLLAA